MIIGISGKAGCGKSTLAELLVSLLGPEWQKMSLGDEVKKEASEIFEFPLWMAYRQESKNNTVAVPTWMKDSAPGDGYLTIHQILQYWGTDVRRAEDPEYWVRALTRRLPPGKHVVIDDIRFVTEVEFIKSKDGLVFRLDQYNGYEPSATGAEHISEIELDDYPFFDKRFCPKFGFLRQVAEQIAQVTAV